MKIHYNKDFECYMIAECHKTNVIELDGVQLIPMTEIEKIKTKINLEDIDCQYEEDYVYSGGLQKAIEIIDNRISELKGENK